MGLFDGIKRQLRSVIQWENPSSQDLFVGRPTTVMK